MGVRRPLQPQLTLRGLDDVSYLARAIVVALLPKLTQRTQIRRPKPLKHHAVWISPHPVHVCDAAHSPHRYDTRTLGSRKN